MKNLIKTLALIAIGVAVGRVFKKKSINLENYLGHFIDEKIQTGDIKNIVPESIINQ